MSILTKKKNGINHKAKTSSIPRNKKNKNKTRTRKNIGKSRKKLRSKDIDGGGLKNRIKKIAKKISKFNPFNRKGKGRVVLENSLKQTHLYNPQRNNYNIVEPVSITPPKKSQSELRHTIVRPRMELPKNQGPVISNNKMSKLENLVKKRKAETEAKVQDNPYENVTEYLKKSQAKAQENPYEDPYTINKKSKTDYEDPAQFSIKKDQIYAITKQQQLDKEKQLLAKNITKLKNLITATSSFQKKYEIDISIENLNKKIINIQTQSQIPKATAPNIPVYGEGSANLEKPVYANLKFVESVKLPTTTPTSTPTTPMSIQEN